MKDHAIPCMALALALASASTAVPAAVIGNTLVEYDTRPPANVSMITVTASLNADLDAIVFRSMGVQAIFSGPGYHDASNWKFASPRDHAVIGWSETYPPDAGPHNAVGTHRQMTYAGYSDVWYTSDRVVVPPGLCQQLVPTHLVSIPFVAPGPVQPAPVSGSTMPAMWLHDRGTERVTNRMAAIRVADDELRIYYRPHDDNGRALSALPAVSLPPVSLHSLPQHATAGIAEIDLWEDGRIHAVRLWLHGGEALVDGALTASVRTQARIDYAPARMRHRVVLFHPFARRVDGSIDFGATVFAYQPLCCAGPIRPCGPGSGRFCP